MDRDLDSTGTAGEPVRVAISGQESHLKEQDRSGPYGRCAADPRQEHLADHRLRDEEKAGTDEDRDRKEHTEG